MTRRTRLVAGTLLAAALAAPAAFAQTPADTVLAARDGSGNLLSFHFFFLRKLFFVKEADALVLCPGGFGTLDEALEVLTLIQTGRMARVPVLMMVLRPDSSAGTR